MCSQQLLELGRDIGVVGVRLVDDQDTLCQAQQPYGLMLRRQDYQDRLVDRRDPDVGEECLAPIVG